MRASSAPATLSLITCSVDWFLIRNGQRGESAKEQTGLLAYPRLRLTRPRLRAHARRVGCERTTAAAHPCFPFLPVVMFTYGVSPVQTPISLFNVLGVSCSMKYNSVQHTYRLRATIHLLCFSRVFVFGQRGEHSADDDALDPVTSSRNTLTLR